MSASVTSFSVSFDIDTMTNQNSIDLATFCTNMANIPNGLLLKLDGYRIDTTGVNHQVKYTYGMFPVASNATALGYYNALVAALAPIPVTGWSGSATSQP